MIILFDPTRVARVCPNDLACLVPVWFAWWQTHFSVAHPARLEHGTACWVAAPTCHIGEQVKLESGVQETQRAQVLHGDSTVELGCRTFSAHGSAVALDGLHVAVTRRRSLVVAFATGANAWLGGRQRSWLAWYRLMCSPIFTHESCPFCQSIV